MNIAIWAEICLSNETGIGRCVRELLRQLVELDERNSYTLCFSANHPPDSLSEFTHRFRVVRLPHTRRWLRAHWLLGLAPLDELLGPHDLVFSPVSYAIPTRAARFRGMIHDLAMQHVPEAYTPLDLAISRVVQRRLVRTSDRILTVSEATKRDLQQYYGLSPDRVHVAHLGVDERFGPVPYERVARFRTRFGIPKRYVFWVGEIQRRKNLTTLIKALARVQKQAPDLALVIAGGTGYRADEVRAEVARLRLQRSVFFTGRLTDDDLVAALTGASVFAFPSLYEGFGLPILEAFACGAPVAAARTSSLVEVVDQAGVLVEPLDSVALAEAILRITSDSALSSSLRERGLERARAFTWRAMAERVLEFLQSPPQSI